MNTRQPTTDYAALLSGLNMIKAMVNDLLSDDEILKMEVLNFYSGFKLAAEGFLEASYLAKTDSHKDLIRNELLKYMTEVKEKLDKDLKIVKFPSN